MSGMGEVLALLALFGKSGGAKAKKGADMPGDAGPLPTGAGPEADASTSAAAPAPGPTPGAAPAPVDQPPTAVVPTSTAPGPTLPWPQGPIPSTLPPFPGPGWEPDVPVTTEVAKRAEYWNALLWDFPTKTQRKPYVQENFGGQWVTWAAAWHPDSTGAPHKMMATEAWRVKAAPAAMPVATSPAQAPTTSVQPSQAAQVQTAPDLMATPGTAPSVVRPQYVGPAHVSPYPGPGAWKSNAAYVKLYQAALGALGYVGKDGKPLAVDGKPGPNTLFAVSAFQGAHGLTVDGQAGATTAAALDAALDALAASHG